MGALTFHPWPVRRPDVDHPDELRLDLDPQPGTSFTDAQRVANVAHELLQELGLRGYPKTSGNGASTSTSASSPSWSFEEVRHAAIGFGRELERRDDGVTTNWWKEERGTRIFLDYNQNNRDRTIASAWSLRPKPGAPVSTPMTWSQLARRKDPAEFNLLTVPDYVADGDPWADMNDVSHSLDPLLGLWESLPGGELNFPPDYPKMPGEPPARAAVAEGRRELGVMRPGVSCASARACTAAGTCRLASAGSSCRVGCARRRRGQR